MKYYLFLDESGDHGLANVNPTFPVFILSGVVISEDKYEILKMKFNQIKEEFWGGKTVIFHSRDIRKCEKEFSILFDLKLKKAFYEKLNSALSKCDYSLIAAGIQNDTFIKK